MRSSSVRGEKSSLDWLRLFWVQELTYDWLHWLWLLGLFRFVVVRIVVLNFWSRWSCDDRL